MRAVRIEASGFRNLARLDLALPPGGAVFLGHNGHGKTNLLELLYYPVLYRSVRGARDADLVQFGEPGFHVALDFERGDRATRLEAGYLAAGRRKRVVTDGVEAERVSQSLGDWLAVAFLPGDVTLVSGGAGERRQFLDRTLALADPGYLRALRQYRGALEQRNAALRRAEPDTAAAFDPALARFGSAVVAARLAWCERFGPVWSAACATLGEAMPVTLQYRGKPELAVPDAWPEAMAANRKRDLGLGATHTGPHRDDLTLALDGAPLRVAGSTGQQRTAAVALKLCERDTFEAAHGHAPALLLDDVFAELDDDRQARLAARLRLGSAIQVFVTAPRQDELPGGLDLPVYRVERGTVAGRMEWQPA